MDTAKSYDHDSNPHADAVTDTSKLTDHLRKIWRIFKKVLFIIIRATFWIEAFATGIPAPMGWLRGVVRERGVDLELCGYYLLEDLKSFSLYLLTITVWALPFVKFRDLWPTLRIDILSLPAALLLTTALYLIYVQWFS